MLLLVLLYQGELYLLLSTFIILKYYTKLKQVKMTAPLSLFRLDYKVSAAMLIF